mmetsp:Transcript_59134/g.69146  ORF Transcript_59134/g.69146 Transcript_59134/m.69146 type:complete len:121 (+) Transcript_59134:3098-3460(+)
MPIDQVIATLTLPMKQNNFQFGDTYWQHIRGVATGTPTACSVANIYISKIEKTSSKNTKKSPSTDASSIIAPASGSVMILKHQQNKPNVKTILKGTSAPPSPLIESSPASKRVLTSSMLP